MISRLSTLVDQPADDEHRDHRADAARRGDQPGRQHREFIRSCSIVGNQRQRAAEDAADQKHQDRAGDEIRALQQVAVEKRPIVGVAVWTMNR